MYNYIDSPWCRPEEAKTQPQWDAAKINPDGTLVQHVVEPHQIFFTPNEEVRWPAATSSLKSRDLAKDVLYKSLKCISPHVSMR